jgi:hypothetical protein
LEISVDLYTNIKYKALFYALLPVTPIGLIGLLGLALIPLGCIGLLQVLASNDLDAITLFFGALFCFLIGPGLGSALFLLDYSYFYSTLQKMQDSIGRPGRGYQMRNLQKARRKRIEDAYRKSF